MKCWKIEKLTSLLLKKNEVMRPIIFILLVFINSSFFIQPANAQLYLKFLGHSTDSIYPKLQDANEKDKMHVYNELAFYHSIFRADSAFYYAEKSLQLAEKYDNRCEKAFALRNMGNAYGLRGEYSQAVYHLQKALSIFEELGSKRKIFELCVDLSKLNYDMEDFERSIFYANKLELLAEQEERNGNLLATPFEMVIITGLTAIVYRDKADYDESIKYFKNYIELSKQLEIPVYIHRTFVESMAETYNFAGEYDSALKTTYEIRKDLPQNRDKPLPKHTGYEREIGRLLNKLGNPDSALPLLRQSLIINKKNRSFFYSSSDACYLGDVFLSQKIYDSALYYYRDAIIMSTKMYHQTLMGKTDAYQQEVYSGYQQFFEMSQAEAFQLYYRQMYRNYRRFYKVYKAMGEAIPALENHELCAAYQDSFNVITANIEERKLQARFQTERYEQQLVLLEKDNSLKDSQLRNNRLILFGTIIILLFILFLVILFFRQQRLRADQEKLQLKQRLLRSQMNPHFIFNSLASIQNFIVKQDDTRASIYLSRFSDLVRSILNNSLRDQITLEDELNTIEDYLELQKIRFPEKFDYTIEVDENIDPENMFIPPMLAQPFIENAIEHGIKHKEIKGNIYVRFKLNESKIFYEVEDDGIGREKAQEILMKYDKNHESLATVITRDRIKVQNKKFKRKILMNIIDLKNDRDEATGTKVIFEIPF